MQTRRVALVHDFLLDVRGAERVFLALCDLFPEADLFTAVYDERGTEGRFADRRPTTSFLQRMRPDARTFRALLPLYPYAMEALDLRGYDLVISSSSAWAHGVIADADAVHLCYCHNPFRYAWNAREATLAKYDPLRRAALGFVFKRWRQWDWIAAQRVDLYAANSDTTRRRVKRYFGRDASVLYPPVETERFAGRGRRRVRRAVGVDAAQAHRPGDRGVQRAAAAARRCRQRARRAAPAAARRPDDPVHRPGDRRRGGLAAQRRQGARRDRHRGVRH